ncbi:MAG: fumarate/nitrate reduction transcriptional regulator Fnr [Gammaproteobacteria bacterium]|nr:MAG: fumarate/nitrate reduction transcriptional regulator Fnr [Gammaproteobacteria bacterium]
MSEQLLNSPVKNISCRICRLSYLCVPHGLSKKELEQLDSVTKKKRKLEKNDFLYKDGEAVTSIYAVRSGSFKTITNNQGGEEQITGFQMPGHLLGLDGLGNNIHTCSTTALETSTVCEIPIDEFDRLCTGNKSLHRHTLRLMGKELYHESQMLLILGKMTGDERFATFLLELSNQHQERGLSAIEFNLTMQRRDIANYLGLSVEALSRLISKLQDRGILDVKHRNIKILNWDLLCKLAHVRQEQQMFRKVSV